MDKKQELNVNLLTLAMHDLIDHVQDAFKKLVHHESGSLYLAVNDLLEAWFFFTRRVVQDSNQLAHAQLVYWQDYLLLCKDLTQRLADNSASTQRSLAAQQRPAVIISFIDKFSFLITQHVHVVIKNTFREDDEEADKKVEFYTRQFTEAFAQHKLFTVQSDALYTKLTAGEASAE